MEDLSVNLKSIVIELDKEEYAIPVEIVGAIERMQQITRVPKTADFVKGVINLRGVITPIIDLRKRFGLEEILPTDSTRIIILQLQSVNVGLIVDAAYDVIDIPKDQIESAPQVIGTVDVDYIEGVAKIGKRLIMLLQLDKVISEDSYISTKDQEG